MRLWSALYLCTYAEFAYRGQQARTVSSEMSVLLTQPKLYREKIALKIDTNSQRVDTEVRSLSQPISDGLA